VVPVFFFLVAPGPVFFFFFFFFFFFPLGFLAPVPFFFFFPFFFFLKGAGAGSTAASSAAGALNWIDTEAGQFPKPPQQFPHPP